MKKKTLSAIFTVCLLSIATVIHAQDEAEGSVFVVTTITVSVPEGGSMAELDSLSKLYSTKLILPNEKIISEKSLMHYFGSDNRDLVIISEYANWCDIEEAGNIMGDLAKAAWPDDEKRATFFQALNSYYKMHSDEIYRGLPQLNK